MKLERKKIKVSDLIVLLNWLRSAQQASEMPNITSNDLEKIDLDNITDLFSGKKFKFKYDDLLLLVSYTKEQEMFVEDIDQLMFDIYPTYEKIKKFDQQDFENKIQENPIFNIYPKDLIEESKRGINEFIEVYEKLLLDYKFEYANIRTIQKLTMENLMRQYIMEEKYEECADIRDKLNDV